MPDKVNGIWLLRGTATQNATLQPVFEPAAQSFIAFPWERITKLRSIPVVISWDDLNDGTLNRRSSKRKRIAGREPLHDHVHDEEGNEGHTIQRPLRGRLIIAGVFWTDGRIKLDIRLEAEPEKAREVLSAEMAHAVDYGLPLTTAHKIAITTLLHPGGADEHTWWEREDYGSEYYTLVGESWMALFTHSYSKMDPWQIPFAHKSTKSMASAVHTILGIEPSSKGEDDMPQGQYPLYQLQAERIDFDGNMNKKRGHANRAFRLTKLKIMVQNVGTVPGAIAVRVFCDHDGENRPLNPAILFGTYVGNEGQIEMQIGSQASDFYLLPANQDIKTETTWSGDAREGTAKLVDVAFDAEQV